MRGEAATLETGREIPPGPPVPSGTARPASRLLRLSGLAVAAAVLLPAVYLVVRSAGGGGEALAETLTEGRTLRLLANTLGLTAAVTATSLAVAVPLAWLTTRTDLPGRRVWTVLTALPLVIPSYVGAYAFVSALGPRGVVQGWLEPFGIDRLPSIYGFPGAWLTLTLFTYPYALLTVRAAIRGLDPSLEEAAASLGHGRRAIFRRIVLPQLRPAIAAGGLLVALYTIHDFGAVSLMRYDTFTRAIYVQYQSSFDRTAAAALSLVLIALSLAVLAGEARSRGRAVYYRVHGAAARPPRMHPLGRWRWPAAAACGALAGLALALPVGVIAVWLARGVRAGTPLRLAAGPAANTLLAAALAAVAAVVAAWPVALLSSRHPGRLSRAVERASFVGFALPGVVVALALVFFGARLVPAVYQTLPMLLFAYVVLFLPQASGALRASLLQVSPNLEEAALTLGRSRASVVRRVLLPLAAPGLLAGYALVFLTVMKELPATLLLAPTGFKTLATQVWTATNGAFFGRAAAPALLLIVLASIPLAFLVLREREPPR